MPQAGVLWCFPSCQNCSIKRTHWAHPVYTLISALRRRPGGAQECCGQTLPFAFDVTLPFAITKSSCGQALMLFRWLAADARVERAGARPSRAVVQTALTCGFLLPLWYGFVTASRAGEDFLVTRRVHYQPICRIRSRALQRQTEHRCVGGALEFRIRVVISSRPARAVRRTAVAGHQLKWRSPDANV
jgi:hypothetical protein